MTGWVYMKPRWMSMKATRFMFSFDKPWTVGYYDPDGEWHPDSDHYTKQEAAERVHYLNGGK